MLRLLVTFVAAICIVGSAGSTARASAAEFDFHAWMDHISPHLRSYEGFMGGFMDGPREDVPIDWRRQDSFMIRLDESGTPVEPYYIPGGEALLPAAHSYALYTGDFHVTPRELIDAGLWPYETVPTEQLDRTITLEGRGSRVLHKSELKHLREPSWMVRAKHEILRVFYDDFMFRPDLEAPPTPQNHDRIELAQRGTTDLPGRLLQFWTNPYTGVPALVSEQPGDLQSTVLSRPMNDLRIPTRSGKSAQGSRRIFQYSGIVDREHLLAEREEAAKIRTLLTFNWNTDPVVPWYQRVATEPALLPGWVARLEADPTLREEYLAALLPRLNPPRHASTNHRSGFALESHGEQAPFETLPCPLGLHLAAHYYALATLDFDVTLRDIIEAGFWPYDTFPTHGLNLDESLYDFSRENDLGLYHSPPLAGQAPQWGGKLAAEIGSAEWLLWRKAEILATVHQELYFQPRSGSTPGDGGTEVLPHFAAFWTNPLATAAAGRPIPIEPGTVMGQLSYVDVNLLRPQFEGSQWIYNQQVPIINLADKQPTDVPLFAYQERSVNIGDIEQRAVFHIESQPAEIRWVMSGDTKRTEFLLLDTGWTWPTQAHIQPGQNLAEVPRPYYTHNHVRLAALGHELGSNMITTFGPTRVRLVYDEVAGILQRSGDPWAREHQGYRWISQSLTGGNFGIQLPDQYAGIDPLTEPPASGESKVVANH